MSDIDRHPRILIFQMTRMGDMLQTSPLIRSLKLKYPNAHITVMLRRMGKSVAERHPDVDEILIYDEDDIFVNLRSSDSLKMFTAYAQAEEYIRILREGKFDIAYNCTQSIGSAMLLKLAGISQVEGACLTDDWQFALHGGWTTYLFTSLYHREVSNINLCDVFRFLAGPAPDWHELIFDVHDEDDAFISQLFQEHDIGPDDFVACFQLGASDNLKRWPAYRFAELARVLQEEYNAHILLLGVPSEEPLGEEFAKHEPGTFIPLFGKTNLGQLAALLRRSKVLVTNDTGTMHVAAAVKCPTVLVSVGYVYFRETGPYGEGHCAIERKRSLIGQGIYAADEQLHLDDIRAQQVACAVSLVTDCHAVQKNRQLEETELLSDVVMHCSAFSPDGALEWYPVIRRPITKADILRMAYRLMWLHTLHSELSDTREAMSIETLLKCYLSPGDSTMKEWVNEFTMCFDGLREMAERGIRTTENLLRNLRGQPNVKAAKTFVADLTRLDEEIRLYGEIHTQVRPLTSIARFERESMEGFDPILLSETTLRIHRDLQLRCHIMQRKLNLIVEMEEQTRNS